MTVYIWTDHKEHWCMFVSRFQELAKVEGWSLNKVLTKKVYDEGADLLH